MLREDAFDIDHAELETFAAAAARVRRCRLKTKTTKTP